MDEPIFMHTSPMAPTIEIPLTKVPVVCPIRQLLYQHIDPVTEIVKDYLWYGIL